MRVVPCRGCGAPVFFAETVNGKKMPLDEESCPEGRFVCDFRDETPKAETAKAGDLRERFQSHFAVCPEAQRFRR